MKRRSREVNIFSMSALDLFASAMGAFILIAVVTLPFFPRTGDSKIGVTEACEQLQNCESAVLLEATQQNLRICENVLETTQQALHRSEQNLQGAQQQLDSCMDQIKQKYLLVIMSWPSRSDIDLHVVDPAGREFYFAEPSFPGSQAALEEDNVNGPGNEVWLHPQATPGVYRVFYKLFNKRGRGATTVRGLILYSDGRQEIPDRNMSREDEKVLVATIVVDSDGGVAVRS